ncbi:hypothetical protein J8281_17520 [Aquimarina sp. U1-2]|uniref:DUF6434 domain-containing protein n=1 Tax=Aquimarina sp. U1-2 TaxID=2823141 RepID=UPI001AEC8E48|nr:DUF6434 domain-containing protein [Aquimarina sp. U1-2]MBP2833999.1 hypothetical protein [Aquimarina sp. U1-2]
MSNRPRFEDITSATEFNSWYWLKKEMVEICKRSNLPSSGTKFQLRDRIMYALDNRGELKPTKVKIKPTSIFNWAKAELTLDTVITDNVSFGPNFRNFMKSQIGNTFNCHGDFMSWVKRNIGKTLNEAILQWKVFEKQKRDPSFKSKIAKPNMFNQYIRDFLDDNKGASLRTAKTYWMLKKQLPTQDGFVIYERSDLQLQDSAD